MQNDTTGVKRDYPTECGIAGRPRGRDPSREASTPENPPRGNVAEWTRGCTGAQSRPSESDDRQADNDSGTRSNYLEAVLERAELREGTFFLGGGA